MCWHRKTGRISERNLGAELTHPGREGAPEEGDDDEGEDRAGQDDMFE